MSGDSHQTDIATFGSGSWPTAPPIGPSSVKNSIRDGKNVWLLPGGSPNESGLLRSANLVGPAGSLIGGAQLYLVGSVIGLVQAGGSIIKYLGGSEFFVGSGPVYLDNVNIATASLTLQFRLAATGGTVYKAGLNALSTAPTVVGTGPNTGRSKGTSSVILARFSSLTGAESNGSPPSAIVALNNEKLRITLGATLPNSTQDTWRIYITPLGFGSENTQLFFQDVVVGTGYTGGTVEVDYLNSELGSKRPETKHNIPQNCLFVGALQNILILFGTGNGAVGISPSFPGDPESFNPDFFLVTTPADVPIGFAARPAQDLLYFWTRSSLQACIYTNDPDFPVQIQSIWPTTGLQGVHAGTFAEDDFYCFSGTAGCPIRIVNGVPDTKFANSQAEVFRREMWPGTTVVGYDRRFDAVVYCHPTLNIARPWMRKIEQWGPPIDIPSGVSAAVTDTNGKLFLSANNVLREWEGGTGGDYFVRTEDKSDPDPGEKKTFSGFRSAINVGVGRTFTEELYLNGATSNPAVTQVTTGTGKLQLTEWKPTSELVDSYAFKLIGNGAGDEIYFTEYSALFEGVRR